MPDLIGGSLTGSVTRQALLPGLQEVLRPAVIEVLVDPLTATQLSDTVLAAQALQNDPDLLFGAEPPTSRPPDVLHDLLGRCFLVIGVPSHLQSLVG